MDSLTPEQRRRTMRRVKSRDTGPEMVIRKALHAMGYRYRLYANDLPGKPDLVFRSRRKVVFVNGCFWHGHSCKAGSKVVKTNSNYWKAKIEKNVERDLRNVHAFSDRGWESLTIWECDIRNSVEKTTRKIRKFLES